MSSFVLVEKWFLQLLQATGVLAIFVLIFFNFFKSTSCFQTTKSTEENIYYILKHLAKDNLSVVVFVYEAFNQKFLLIHIEWNKKLQPKKKGL